MKFTEFLKQALSSDSSTSSKRICGLLGWIICLLGVIYAVITKIESPDILTTLFITSSGLLGLDSITNIFKK